MPKLGTVTSIASHENQLEVYEWVAVGLILSLMGFLTLFSYLNTTWVTPSMKGIDLLSSEIEVYVHGAIENPGPIKIKRDSTLNDLLKIIAIKPNADLNKKRLHSKLKPGQVILIPEKKDNRRTGKRTLKKLSDF